MQIKDATGPFDTIEKHGPVAGVGVVFVIAGVLITIGSKVPTTITNLSALMIAVGPFAGFGALLILVGVGLILFRIGQYKVEKQRLIDEAKAERERLIDEAKAERERLVNEAKDRKKVDQPDLNVLSRIVTQMSTHEVLFMPMEYEDIGEVVNSTKILEQQLPAIVSSSTNVVFAAQIVQKITYAVHDFNKKILDIEKGLASTADAYVNAQKRGAPRHPQKEKFYLKLSRPVIAGSTRMKIEELTEADWHSGVRFVSALSELRGRVKELLNVIKDAGVALPLQFH